MRILAVDIGTGTQDILLFDSNGPAENSVKMVMPSPTTMAARRIKRATAAGQAVVLVGTIQGGGPCAWAVEDHIRAGLPVFATPEAALTFDDEIERVEGMGVKVISDDEARGTRGEHVELRDFDLGAMRTALAAFGDDGDFDGIAVGCLDHGNAPPGVSDRLFRFQHLQRVVEGENDLRGFAYLPQNLPDYLTRAQALVRCLPQGVPAVFLDTGPAAALGALQDLIVAAERRALVLNLGNMHALAFHVEGDRIISLYEHHTGEMATLQIEDFSRRLVAGTLAQDEVFGSQGHGVLYAEPSLSRRYAEQARKLPLVALTGPQRGRLRGSNLNPYLAAPHGDMMISGCFGMVRAFAYRYPDAREEIEKRLKAD